MKIRSILYGITLVAVTATITSTVVSQDKTKTPTAKPTAQDHGMPALPKEVEEMFAKCKEAGKPGENHQLLAKKAGKWNCTGKFWMTPEMPPMEQTFTTDAKSIYDGRYLIETVEGQTPEGTFLGQSWGGYDNVTKKFFSSWISNDCSGKMDATGTYDASTKTFTYATQMSCPVAGKVVSGRTVEKWVDNDHINVTMYGPWPQTGKEYKMMEFTYARAK